MKWKHFFSAFQFGYSYTLMLLLMSAALSWVCILSLRFVSLGFSGGELVSWYIFIMGIFTFMVPTGTSGFNMWGSPRNVTGFEFLFSRAISKKALFFSRACIYLAVCAVPLLSACIYSRSHSEAKVAIMAADPVEREAAARFYSEHFEDVRTERDAKGNLSKILLPYGAKDYADYRFLLGMGMAILFQLLAFIFWKFQWVPFFLFVTMAVLLMISTYQSLLYARPSAYAVALVWCTHHAGSMLLIISAFAILAQLYCCHKFINTEIES